MRAYGEFDFIAEIRELFARIPNNGFEGIGDDCAVLPIGEEALLFTSDMLNEGVHFLTERSTPYQIGYKSAMVNISDIAAMGAQPVATLLSLALPKERFGEWSAEFMRGYHAASKKYGIKLVGGDTTKSKAGVCVNVTAIGRAPMTEIKRRAAAKVGDIVMVTGKLGASAAGLRDVLTGKTKSRNARVHLMPEARVTEGVWLGKQSEVHAMMDISDGIASDLEHIAKQSKKSVVVTWKNLPIAKGATAEDAFGGGEDYELLLTVDRRKADDLARRFEEEFEKPLYKIGKVVKPNYDCYKILIERDSNIISYSTNLGGYRHC